jgi:ketosteroid isomerase-like protein
MKLSKTVANLIAAQDKYDSKAFADNFSDDAVVYDEGKTYHGKKEIRQWNELTNEKYKTKYEPLEVSVENEKVILTVKVSGTFDGSPITLKYHFTIKDEKIQSLKIS